MTSTDDEATRREPGVNRALIVAAGAGTILASAGTVVLCALVIPALGHLPLSIVFFVLAAFLSGRAASRRHAGLGAVIAGAAVLPLIYSEWSIRLANLAFIADVPLGAYVGVLNILVMLLLAAAVRAFHAPAFMPLAVVAAAIALIGIGASLFPAAAVLSRLWAGVILVAAAGTAWPWLVGSLPARITARSAGAVASIAALVVAAATWPSVPWGTSAAFVLTASVFAVHLLTSPVAVAGGDIGDQAVPQTRPIRIVVPTREPARVRELGAWKTASAIGLGLALAGAAAGPATVLSSLAAQLTTTAALSTLLSAALAIASWRLRHNRSSPGLRLSGIVLLLICAITAIPSIGLGAIELWARISVTNFTVDALAPHEIMYPEISPFVWITAALLTAGTTVTLLYAGQLRRLSWLPIALGALTLLVVHATAPTLAISAAAGCALTLAATTLFIVLRPRRGRRTVLISTVLISSASSFLVGAGSTAVWPVTALVAIGCLVALRFALPRRVARPDKLAISPVFTALATLLAIFTARWIPIWQPSLVADAATASALTTVITASAVLILAALTAHRFVGSDAAVASTIAALTAVLGVAALASQNTPASRLLFVIALAGVLLAELSWQIFRGGRQSAARYVTAVLTPPTAVLLAVVAWRRFGPSIWGAPELLAVGIAAVLAGLGIVLFRGTPARNGQPRSHPARLAWDSSIALTSIVTVPAALTTSEFGPLNLILLGVIPILFSFGEGSIWRSGSRRRHLVWASLPPLGAAIWVALDEQNSGRSEIAGLALACLIFAALAIVTMRRPRASAPVPPGRNMLTISALAVALVPAVTSGITGSIAHAAVLIMASTVLCGLGAFLPSLVRGIHLGLWMWLGGLIAVAVMTSVRSYALVDRRPFAWDELVVWSVAGAAFTALAGVLWLRRNHPQTRPAIAAIAVAPLLLALPLANVSAIFAVPGWMLALVAAGTTGFVAYSLDTASRRRDLIVWTATIGAAFLAVGTITGAHTAVEFVSAPVGFVAIAVNLRLLARVPDASSMRTLGAPLAALVLPSLLQSLSDPAPPRIAWLVLCIAAIAAFGVVTRLKAPLIVAAAAASVVLLSFIVPVARTVTSGWTVAAALLVLTALSSAVILRSQLSVARAVRRIARMR
ncbi:SCO7613 C-terminal domain-containing membrane protein [Microbacterium sp. MPKO10]|uniref:SCO7613 C-terminal domain-containing membrane protein n=1 Tax=Microbacterium sp. MPKO10 TaxID=2989818 RepID=UPI002235544C|nr:hypothetical protein [Microbacterium sp. MPKO10]MCW4459711.1 hypothetical protein [Microbacterium sp. MPKO10]